MTRESVNQLERLYSEFVESDGTSGTFESFVRLGEVWNCVQNSELTTHTRENWISRIVEAGSRISSPETLQAELDERIRGLERIVSIGTEFIFEEIVVIISERIQIDLILKLPSKVVETDRALLKRIDSEIATLSSAPKNQAALRSAKNRVRKSWSSPINHQLIA